MRAKLLPILLVLTAFSSAAWAQGFAGLGEERGDFAEVRADLSIDMETAFDVHPAFKVEWWYVTANLETADGRALGVQWTLFRRGTEPVPVSDDWTSPHVWMAHAALTTEDRHYVSEGLVRAGGAAVTLTPFSASMDRWHLAAPGGADPGRALIAEAAGDGFSYRLSLTADRPPVRHGIGGYSQKSAAGLASYYFSQPFYSVSGTVMLDGKELNVSGRAWLDREWSSQPLTDDQEGWDWFSLHLAEGRKLMVYQLRHSTGAPYATGSLIAADGTLTPLAPGAVKLTAREWHQIAGRSVPTAWRIESPQLGLRIDTRPLNPASWMDTLVSYWEGPIRFENLDTGGTGVGYLEMTGY